MSAYRVAIDQTTVTIDRRAKYFRNLIVAVVLVSLGSMVWAVFARSILPISSFLLLFPVCGLFFFLDCKLLIEWRSLLLEGWARGELDFSAFLPAVGAIPMLPKNTLQSMLATLPSAGDILTEQRVSPSTREAVAIVVTIIHACHSDIVAFKAAALAIIAVSAILAVTLRMWQPFIAIIPLAVMPLLQYWLRCSRLKGARKRTLAAQRLSEFNIEKYSELVANLHWEPFSTSTKDEFIKVLQMPGRLGKGYGALSGP